MEVRRIPIADAVTFAFKCMLHHVRLFSLILLTGTVIIAGVVGIIGLLNKDFIQSIMLMPGIQELQQCVGANCFMFAYQSSNSLLEIVLAHIFSLLIGSLIMVLVFTGLDLGFKRVALDLLHKDESNLEVMFSCFRLIFHGLFAWILYCVMIWIGWFFFIIPGFFALLRFAFFPYCIVDKKVGAIEALKMSYHITSGHLWDMFAFWVVVRLIVYIGYLSWIGVILTWPLSTLAYAYVYRQLIMQQPN